MADNPKKDPKEKTTLMLDGEGPFRPPFSPQCTLCKHYTAGFRCKAYPDKDIPMKYWSGQPHTEPTNGYKFEPAAKQDTPNEDGDGKANPYHDELGRFTTKERAVKPGSGGSSTKDRDEEARRIDVEKKYQGPKNRRSQLSQDSADLIRRIKENEGYTYDPVTGKYKTGGYALSIFPRRGEIYDMKEVTPEILQAFMNKNEDLLTHDLTTMGAWWNKEDGKVYLDVSIVESDLETAKRYCREANQIAMFNLATFEEIPCGGTGKAFVTGAVMVTQDGEELDDGSAEPIEQLRRQMFPNEGKAADVQNIQAVLISSDLISRLAKIRETGRENYPDIIKLRNRIRQWIATGQSPERIVKAYQELTAMME